MEDLEYQLDCLMDALDDCDDPDEREDIRGEIFEMEDRIRDLEYQ